MRYFQFRPAVHRYPPNIVNSGYHLTSPLPLTHPLPKPRLHYTKVYLLRLPTLAVSSLPRFLLFHFDVYFMPGIASRATCLHGLLASRAEFVSVRHGFDSRCSSCGLACPLAVSGTPVNAYSCLIITGVCLPLPRISRRLIVFHFSC